MDTEPRERARGNKAELGSEREAGVKTERASRSGWEMESDKGRGFFPPWSSKE